MGHYDSCYETDYENQNKEWEKQFIELSKKLTPYQKSFINTIMKDVEKWMTFVEVIKNLK